jgi:hypothetical protein
MALQESQVSLDGGERGTQLVRCVGDEAALGLRGALQRRKHLIERLHDLRQLVVSARLRYALAQVAKTCPSRRGGGNGLCRCHEF